MYVKIRLPYKVVKDALLIPEASIGTGQAGRYVYLVDENNRVVQQTVKVGVLSNDGMREIVSGVTPDEPQMDGMDREERKAQVQENIGYIAFTGHDRETSERKNKTLIYSYVQYIFH
jgi:multidrug efflux pump subunit AcrA (membrane-fusion protein)